MLSQDGSHGELPTCLNFQFEIVPQAKINVSQVVATWFPHPTVAHYSLKLALIFQIPQLGHQGG